jgi:hypothetical protein
MGKFVPETINDSKWHINNACIEYRVISNLFYMFNQKKDEVEINDIVKQRNMNRRYECS